MDQHGQRRRGDAESLLQLASPLFSNLILLQLHLLGTSSLLPTSFVSSAIVGLPPFN